MKYKLKEDEFLNWYFSDKEDLQIMGSRVKSELIGKGEFNINTRELLNECGYVPVCILEDYDGIEEEVSPQKCILIKEDKQKINP